jgi:hypothetical protein
MFLLKLIEKEKEDVISLLYTTTGGFLQMHT